MGFECFFFLQAKAGNYHIIYEICDYQKPTATLLPLYFGAVLDVVEKFHILNKIGMPLNKLKGKGNYDRTSKMSSFLWLAI